MLDYIINPVLMGGLVKETDDSGVRIHLHGRLGVLTVPQCLLPDGTQPEPGLELRFYFSYLRINTQPYDYDAAALRGAELTPVLLGAELIEVNDTAVKARIQDGYGTVAVPRRWVFTDVPLAVGQTAEFYLSRMQAVGKREIPAEFI